MINDKSREIIWLTFVILIIALLSYCCYYIIKFPYIGISDQFQLIDMMVLKNDFLFKTSGSRFFPFLMLEFQPFFHSNLQYDTIMIIVNIIHSVKIILLFLLIYLTTKLYTNKYIAILAVYLFFIFSREVLFILMLDLIHGSEVGMAICFTAFAYFFSRFHNTQKIFFLALCLVIAFYCTYIKEVSFVFFTTFCLFRLILMRKECSKKEILLHTLLLINTFVFLVLYYKFTYASGVNYASGRVNLGKIDLIMGILSSHKLISISFCCLFIRLLSLIKYKKFIIADTLLASSACVVLAYTVLHLNAAYYFFPLYPILIIALVQYAYLIYLKIKECFPKFTCYYLGTILLLLFFVFFSTFSYYSRSFVNELRTISQRIYGKSYATMFKDIENNNITIYPYLPRIDEFPVPFAWHFTEWHYIVLEKSAKFYKDLSNYSFNRNASPDETKKAFTKNDILLVDTSTPLDTLSWLEEGNISIQHSDYKFIFYPEILPEVVEAFCAFGNVLYDKTQENMKVIFPNDWNLMNSLQCMGNSNNILSITSGLSGLEAWGQWSDADILTLYTKEKISDKYQLKLDVVHVFHDNAKYPAIIKIGDKEYELLIDKPGEYSLDLELTEPTNKIEIVIPKPQSPKELGMSEDTRKLGYGFAPNGVRIEKIDYLQEY